jgi:type II secretory ATPase GspE/PulE/Tfp pilus assembly ATPase PilB-like protein
LLFSTFHANDAATAIPRLLEMKIEPFLLASTLEIIIAQRLARRICERCRTSIVYSPDKLRKILPNAERYFPEGKANLYKANGCPSCNESGYKGRIGIFEIIPISREMRNLILKDPSTDQVWQFARKEGSKSLFEDGLEKVKNGYTTLEELLRIASPEEIQ